MAISHLAIHRALAFVACAIGATLGFLAVLVFSPPSVAEINGTEVRAMGLAGKYYAWPEVHSCPVVVFETPPRGGIVQITNGEARDGVYQVTAYRDLVGFKEGTYAYEAVWSGVVR